MGDASYNEIAEWYDTYLRENPIYADIVLPNVLALVGDVQGQSVCDLACGQGWIARELARRGAHVTGIDLAENLLTIARQHEMQSPLHIEYVPGDAQVARELAGSSFNGCICVMALMNMPDIPAVFSTVRRILKPGGWFVFAITHPCFQTPGAQWITTPEGKIARVVNAYFNEDVWTSTSPGGVRSRVGEHHRMLSTYLNTLVDAGLIFEQMVEPAANDEISKRLPGNWEVPSIMLLRARRHV
ncbi:MAG: class I SAM-dependent methyltransferase [Ktedonobacteraceae bacterium]